MAVALDNEEWPEVVGTIAGDDTILVITQDNPTAESVQEKLLALARKRLREMHPPAATSLIGASTTGS